MHDMFGMFASSPWGGREKRSARLVSNPRQKKRAKRFSAATRIELNFVFE